jgi:hypothetical protein
MNCETMQGELVGFHFGAITDADRRGIEAHLASCPACLGAYFALKRDVETAELEPRPSSLARERLRNAVARELRVSAGPVVHRWWERPLAFSSAAAAVVLALFTTHLLATVPGAPPHGLSELAAPAHPAR